MTAEIEGATVTERGGGIVELADRLGRQPLALIGDLHIWVERIGDGDPDLRSGAWIIAQRAIADRGGREGHRGGALVAGIAEEVAEALIPGGILATDKAIGGGERHRVAVDPIAAGEVADHTLQRYALLHPVTGIFPGALTTRDDHRKDVSVRIDNPVTGLVDQLVGDPRRGDRPIELIGTAAVRLDLVALLDPRIKADECAWAGFRIRAATPGEELGEVAHLLGTRTFRGGLTGTGGEDLGDLGDRTPAIVVERKTAVAGDATVGIVFIVSNHIRLAGHLIEPDGRCFTPLRVEIRDRGLAAVATPPEGSDRCAAARPIGAGEIRGAEPE